MNRVLSLVLFTTAIALTALPQAAMAELKFEKGLRIAIEGGTLAERMQHDGYLEAEIQARFPGKEIVVRNLGFSGDRLSEQLRVQGFGSPDEHLERVKADAIFAFWGFSEAFDGKAGLDDFKNRLAKYIESRRAKKYNGSSAPEIVLFSPIAHEDLNDPKLPDGKENNERFAMYTAAMKEVAEANDAGFVDLFSLSKKLYETHDEPLTINGIHLNSTGNRLLAAAAASEHLGKAERSAEEVKKIAAAVADKNFYYFNRYQPTDGYNVHGGRSHKVYKGVSNRVVMMRELKILDEMTANRDKRVWAVANGKELKVDDSNTSAFIPTPTNFPGKGKDGAHIFLSGEESLKKMTTGKNMKVSLFASEEQFPELVNPVQMAFDTKGRLFVCAWPSYPHWTPKDKMDDKLLILKDTNNDGKADECKVFAGGLHNPTGFEFWGGGVLVAMQPDILFLKDTDGDDVADVRMRVLHGISSGDTHHAANSFVLSPGGAMFFQEGTFHRSQIETPYGTVRNKDGCVWRFEPGTYKVDRYIPHNFANPHGHVFERWGQGFMHDGTGAVPYHDTLFSGHVDYPGKHPRPPLLYNRRTRPCPATEILSSRHFPPEMQGNLLVQNVIGFQGILQYKIAAKGASFAGTEIEPIIQSTDLNFRPVDLEIAPDGSLYFTDWQNPIIGHLQHHIRDPNRDKKHGRVFRITYEGRELLKPAKIAGEPIPALLDLLKSPEDRTRYRTRIELSGRDSKEVVAAAQKWVASLDKDDANYEHNRLEGLWVHQQHDTVNQALLEQVLRSPDHRARAAATRVLCYQRDRVKEPLELLRTQVNDEHPLVRLEAVRALSFFRDSKAEEVVTEALLHETDEYLKYTIGQTTKQLSKFSK